MNELYTALQNAGEFYAAELLVNTDRSPLYRYSRAAAAFFEHAALTPYDGGRLYPCGASLARRSPACVKPDFAILDGIVGMEGQFKFLLIDGSRRFCRHTHAFHKPFRNWIYF